MFSDDSKSRMLAEELEKILDKINQEENSSDRKRLRQQILPAYEKAIKDGGETESYNSIMRTISKDDWTY